MTKSEVGKDGAYRMIIEDRYKKLAGVRRDAKLLSVLGGLYGFFKMGLMSVEGIMSGEPIDLLHAASVSAILLAFVLFSFALGGGKPHKEIPVLLYLYAMLVSFVGSKALLDVWNNPVSQALLMRPAPSRASPYNSAVAKVLVQKLDIDPATAIRDVDICNLLIDFGGAFVLLAAAAATMKYLQLKKQPVQGKKAA